MDRLISLIKKLSSPCCVGLDTKLEFVPQQLKMDAILKFKKTKKAAAFSILKFNKEIINEIKDIIPAVKLQMACYEVFGAYGIKALEETAQYAKEAGMYVIFDGKRNDIGSSMELYSKAYLGEIELFDDEKISPFCCDSLTINGYLGQDTIRTVLKDCNRFEKTVFVLWKTSNPSSDEIQNFSDKDGKKMFERMAEISQLEEDKIGKFGFKRIGAVVGATKKEEMKILRELFKNTFFLIPGYGAQGATEKDIKFAFRDGVGGIVNSSRQILLSWKKNNVEERFFAKQARKEAEKMKNLINSVI